MSTETKQRRDVRDIAKLLISHYGERAYAHASHQALKARERGDKRLMEAWHWIAGAVRDVLRGEPDEDGQKHG
jgi:hypothetical protein